MKRYQARIALGCAVILAIIIEHVARQLYDPDLGPYDNEVSYNLHSVAMFMGSASIALSIKIGHFVRIPALVWASSTLFDMAKELTSLNNQNDLIQWIAYWFVVTLTFVYGVSEFKHSNSRLR
jgi:hypothetical protein